jgi:hypothetical protein
LLLPAANIKAQKQPAKQTIILLLPAASIKNTKTARKANHHFAATGS